MMGTWIGGAAFALVVVLFLGAFWGLLYRALWAAVHGADRTPRAARSVALVALAVQLVMWLVFVAVEAEPEVAGLACFALGFSLPHTAALYAVLRQGASTAVPAAPQEPDALSRDHDGLTFDVRWKPAWISAVVVVIAVALPVPMAFAAIAWSRAYRRTTVRVRNDALAVGDETVSLHGALLEDDVRHDGTPILRVVASDRALELPVGGAPPAEVAWMRETLAAAIRDAEEVRVPPQPEALRRLRLQQ
jgi:hypothetical protein